MKKYKASYTVEATFVMVITVITIVGIMMVTFFMADCQTTRNTLIINSIKKTEEFYFYADDNTRLFKENAKVTDVILGRSFNTSTRDFEGLIRNKLLCSSVTNTCESKEITGIRTEALIDGRVLKAYFYENITSRNNADFMRIVSLLANGGNYENNQ